MKTPPDSALADAQGIIADLKRQLAEGAAELEEALAQQTATTEVLQVINSSPGDLAPVFDAILGKAHTLCGATKGALCLLEGEYFAAVATRGLSAEYAALLRAPQENPPGSPPARLLAGERLVHIEDFATINLPIPRAGAEQEGARTVLFIPLRKEHALLGPLRQVGHQQADISPQHLKQLAEAGLRYADLLRLVLEAANPEELERHRKELVELLGTSQ